MEYFNWNVLQPAQSGKIVQVILVKTSLDNIAIGDYVTSGILNTTLYMFRIDNDPTATSGQTYYPQNLANGFGGDYTTLGFIISKELA